MRQGEWKLIGNVQDTSGGHLSAEDKRLFLANLALDVSEKRNLGAEHPKVVERLLNLRRRWATAQKVPVASTLFRDKAGNEK